VDAGDPGLHHDLGFAERRTANADRTCCNLAAGAGGGFVGLGMRPQRNAASARILRHLGDVAIEGFDVDDERRRVERGTTTFWGLTAASSFRRPTDSL
jgi:hypothetical protein